MTELLLGEDRPRDVDYKTQRGDEIEATKNTVANILHLKNIEIRNNIGSTAGAGSGTFHKYRNHKRREMFRLLDMHSAARKVSKKYIILFLFLSKNYFFIFG